MPGEKDQKRPRKPRGEKEDATLQTPIGHRRRDKRAKSAPIDTSIKLGRSVRTGGAYVLRVSRRAVDKFNSFTQSDEELRPKKRRSGLMLTYPIFIAASLVVLVIALMILDNSTVQVEKKTVSIVGLDKDLEGYTILFMSDLHGREFGANQASILRTINGLSYNLVLFGGDMVGASGDTRPFYTLLEGMTANRKTYFIAGDSDPDPLLTEARDEVASLDDLVLSDWVIGARARGAEYLDVTTGVPVGAATLWLSPAGLLSLNIPDTLTQLEEQVEQETEGVILGVQADHNSLPFTDYRYKLMEKLSEAAHLMSQDDLHIALSHFPPAEEYIEVTQELGQTEDFVYLRMVDLVLAGHYCGGGWKLPALGAFYLPSTLLPRHGWFPAREDVEGFKQLGSTQLYTSPGLGMSDRIYLPNFRLLNSPRITLITLTSAITEENLRGD